MASSACRHIPSPSSLREGEGSISETQVVTRHLQELSDITPIHTHRGHFGAAVLVELVAARLATESVQKELLAYVAEGQLQVRFPNLKEERSGVKNPF